MSSRHTRALAALVAAGAVAVPAIAQARGGSDDPPNHEQREHQGERHRGRDRVGNDHRGRHDRFDNHRRDGRGSDDGPNHR
jgi:hypothetical protein